MLSLAPEVNVRIYQRDSQGRSAVTEFRLTSVWKTVDQAQLNYMDKGVVAFITKQHSTRTLTFRKKTNYYSMPNSQNLWRGGGLI